MYAALGTCHSTLIRYVRRRDRYVRQLDACAVRVDAYRRDHPGCGLRKLYRYLRSRSCDPVVEGLSRDRFVAGMLARGRGLTPLPSRPVTTRSGTQRFDNQTRGLIVAGPDQLWVSDTTYFRMRGGPFAYLTFVVDVYTRLILGYVASMSLGAEANVEALQMARDAAGAARLRGRDVKLVFHSDGAGQYGARDFVAALADIGAVSSMGFVAQENAFAERVNGIIKAEFLAHWPEARASLSKLRLCLAHAVDVYNTVRLHDGLPGDLSPRAFAAEYAGGMHRDYVIVVKEWDHNPYASTDKFTGTPSGLSTPQELSL